MVCFASRRLSDRARLAPPCGIEQRSACLAHNQEVGGSNPSPATIRLRIERLLSAICAMWGTPSHQPNYQLFSPFWAFSSVGKNSCLINSQSGVQVPEGPPVYACSSAEEHEPSKLGVACPNHARRASSL